MLVKRTAVAAVLACVVVTGLTAMTSSQETPPYNNPQPANSEQRDSPQSEAKTKAATDQQHDGGNDKGKWNATFKEHPTEWLLVIFTFLLVVFNFGLWWSTWGLWEAGQEQARDMKSSIAEAKRSADAAFIGAEAAKKSADVATQNMIHAQRANIKIAHAYSVHVQDAPNEPIKGHSFQMVFVNAGLTNALSVQVSNKMEYFPGEAIPGDYNFKAPLVFEEGAPTLDAAPGFEIRTEPYGVAIDVIRAVEKKQGILAIFGEVRYRDVFEGSQPHLLEYCMIVSVRRDPTVPYPAGPLEGPFSFGAYKRHNSSR
jgi:hypothetical protein